MLPEDILSNAPLRLSQTERRHYFEKGYVAIDSAIDSAWIGRLRAATAELLAASRDQTASGPVFVLEEGHTGASARLHRVLSPQDQHPAFWDFIRSDEMSALAADVVGPDVKFHHAKLNLKSKHGSRGFKWHQDIQAWPHTDYSPVTIGVYIEGCTPQMGPLSMVPGSHQGPLYSMYDAQGHFAVQVRDEEIAWLTDDMVDAPIGGPGTAVLLNCRTIHGSASNQSHADRPMLLAVYSSADSYPYTASPIASPHLGEILRGRPARYACFDTRPCELPPDWGRTGYASPWKLQQDAEERGTSAGGAGKEFTCQP
jgi:ectoine hydroxylase